MPRPQSLSTLISLLIPFILVNCALAQPHNPVHSTPIIIGKVTDGDTVVSSEGDRIRLWGIDAPEADQPYGKQATETLKALLRNKVTYLEIADRDRYGRQVARLFTSDGTNINLALVCDGAAWWYAKYAPSATELSGCEADARAKKLGLWAEETPINPSDWRRGNRSSTSVILVPFSCGEKNRCSQMTSCDEANYHLNQCGLGRLDGDGDGVPCESICS